MVDADYLAVTLDGNDKKIIEIPDDDQKITKGKAAVNNHISKSKKRPSFVRSLAYYEMRFIIFAFFLQKLPATFVREAGLRYKSRTMIRGQQGREWPDKLLGWRDYHRIHLSAGWSKFTQDNGLSIGDTQGRSQCVGKRAIAPP
ncbi:hypothetical protein CRG98_042727 [Punica granatum]|uniref:TF-B3 domain-containing protein n=1 Tax=Punica granatum TaxID=22663 RepID=A0A2I0HYV4_PUNGR|nr:hypothetical protein CRG98_042727 [Punica granatum]